MASGSTFAPISPVLSNSPRHRGAAQQNWRQLLIVGGVSSLLAFALAELGDLREHPFVLLQSLVVLVVWLTGTGAGVAALPVGLLAVMLLTEWTTADLIAAAVFTIAGGAMAGLDHARRLTHRRLLAATEDALVRYRSLVRHAPVALALFDTDMRYLACSERWTASFGLPAAYSLVGMSHYAVFPTIPERWKQIHQRALAGEASSSKNDPFEHDGRVYYLNWWVHPWRASDDGAISGLVILS